MFPQLKFVFNFKVQNDLIIDSILYFINSETSFKGQLILANDF